MLNGLILCIFLLFGVMLLYILMSHESDAKSGKNYLYQHNGTDTLLFLEDRENYKFGDLVLVKGTEDNAITYNIEHVEKSDESQVVLTDYGTSYAEDKENIVGLIAFESQLLGAIMVFLKNPNNTNTIIFSITAIVLFLICCNIGTFLFMKKKKRQKLVLDNERKFDQIKEDTMQQTFLDQIYTQEINEPQAILSVGNDENPMTENDIEVFRNTIMKS